MNILLIGYGKMGRMIEEIALERNHKIVHTIDNDYQWKTLEGKEVDIILMDIRMPIMNGVEATKIIKEKYPHIKILILTTFNEDEYIFEGLNNGADGYILKDVSSKELVNNIKSIYNTISISLFSQYKEKPVILVQLLR